MNSIRLSSATLDARSDSTAVRAALWRAAAAALTFASLGLSGCNKLDLAGNAQQELRREAEGRAIGGGCRHSGRALEDCFALNRQAGKAAIFAGWREMNDYMAQKNLAPVAPVVSGDTAAQKAGKAAQQERSAVEPAAAPASGSAGG